MCTDRTRLMMHAIEVRKTCRYAAAETPFDYKLPQLRNIAPAQTVKLKTPLGHNRYF